MLFFKFSIIFSKEKEDNICFINLKEIDLKIFKIIKYPLRSYQLNQNCTLLVYEKYQNHFYLSRFWLFLYLIYCILLFGNQDKMHSIVFEQYSKVEKFGNIIERGKQKKFRQDCVLNLI